MASPSYPEKLNAGYQEFAASDNSLHLPPEKRLFRSTAELIVQTPAFWATVVLLKLEADFTGLRRYPARPGPAGANPYFTAIPTELDRIRKMATAASS